MMKEYEIALADAYGETIDREAEALAAEAEKEPHVFTKRFEERMAELIRTGKPNNRKGLSKRGRRILLIAAAAVLVLAAVACAVPEIRESLTGFFVKVFGDHEDYVMPDGMKDRIEEEYGLVPIPEGYSVVYYRKSDYAITATYENEKHDTVKLEQYSGKSNPTVNNEHGEILECKIGGKDVRLVYREDSAVASWIENGYFFFLTCHQHIDLEEFKSMIASVQMLQ